MKYTIFGLQQQALIENDLSLEDALIIERLIWLSGIYSEEIIDNKSYKWIAYSKIKEEVPIVAKNDIKIRRIMQKLESKKIIERIYKKANNKTKVYFHFTNKIKILTDQKSTVITNQTNLTGQLTDQKCSPANRSKMIDESSSLESSSLNTSGAGEISAPKHNNKEKHISTVTIAEINNYVVELLNKDLNYVNIDGKRITFQSPHWAADFEAIIIKMLKHYRDNDWKDKNDKPVLNWKNKLRNNWYKDIKEIIESKLKVKARKAG